MIIMHSHSKMVIVVIFYTKIQKSVINTRSLIGEKSTMHSNVNFGQTLPGG